MAGDVQIRVNVDGANDAARDLSQIDRELASLSGSADQAGKAFQGLSRFTSAAHLERFRDTFRDTGVQVNNASKEIDQLASRMQRVARDNAFRQLAQDANLSHTQIARLRAQMGDYSGALSSLGAAVGQHKVAILAAGAAMVAFGKSCLDAQIEMERLEQSYKAVFGAQASAQLKAVYEQANRVGLKFQETAEAAKGFFAAGQGTALEKDLQSIFKAVTDSGAALQLSTDEVNGALVALGQMMSKGKVQAEELRGQLGERLPGAFQMAAKAMGMTTAELDKFMADGKLTAEDLLPKLAAALEEQYGEAALKAANTVQGSINRLETEWFRFKARVLNAGPVQLITEHIERYLKVNNDAADKAKSDAAIEKELRAMGVKPEGSRKKISQTGIDVFSEVTESFYTEEQLEKRRQHLREAEKMRQEYEKTLQEENEALAKHHELTDKLAEKSAASQEAALERQKKAIRDATDKALAAAKAQGSSEEALAAIRERGALAIAELGKKQANIGQSATSSGRASASAAKSAAVSQAGYNGEIERTEQHIKSLQQQLNLDKTETLTAAKIKAEEKYQDTISKTNEELAKRLARKEISSTQADEIRKLKEQEASLQKQYDIRNATTKASQKQAQITQGQLKFYKELGQLSGNYGNTVELQNGLIEEQAQKYRDIYGISEDLVAQWEYYQKLQISTDPFDGALRGLLRFSNEYQDQGKVWEDLTYNFSRSFVDQTGDMFDEFLETGKISLDGFKDLFKSFLKQLAWQAVAQPIMVNIMGSLMGSSSGGVASAAGLMGGGSNDLIGTTTNAFFAAGGQGGGIMDVGLGIGKNYASRQLFGGEGGLMGGITDTINSTVSSMMPSMFAGSQNIATANIASNAFFEAGGASAALPTTTFTSAIGTAGIGGMVGGIASPFVNSLFGVENNQGSQVGSMIGGGLGTVGGAMMAAIPAMAAIPGIGWIGAGVAALGSIVGGLIGGGLGTQPKQEPKLEVDLVGSLWKPVSDAKDMQVFNNGGPIAAWDPNTGAYRSAVETSHGAKGAWDITTAYGNVMQQTAEVSWGIADALGTITDDMKTQYLKNLEELGEINIHGIHRGEWINEANIQAFADWYVGEATGNMLIALSNIDLTPLTIAADGMAADTAEELGTAIGNILSYVNIGQAIEDETMRDNFYDSIEDQMVNALGKVSLAPLAIAADGFAVDTVDELSTALKDVFTAYDMGETIQDEDLKKAYQAKMQELIESAFDGIDLSFLRVDFDQNSFAGLQQAYAAVKAWEEVDKAIEDFLNPASEFETQMDAIESQFDAWIDMLKQLGWQEEAIAEVEQKRIKYIQKMQEELERSMRQDLSLRFTALKSGSDSNVYALQSLLFQQANEREQWKSQFGEDHDLYKAGVGIQQAEFTETLLNQFKAMRDELLAQQKAAEQERIQDEMEALQDRIKAEQDEINARLKALQDEINAKQKEISEAERLADKFRRLAKNLEEYRRNLWTGENNLTGSRYNEAYSQFNDLYQKALAGDEDAFNSLTGKATELLQLGRDQLPERGEYNDLFYDVDQKLKRAQLYAEQQVSQAEKELEVLNAQLEAMQKEQEDLNLRLDALQAELQAQQEILQAQLDALNENTEATREIPYTLEQLNAAISYLSGALNTQVGGDSHAGGKTDWERLISEKVYQLNAGAYQGRTNWTREDFIKAATESYGSVERWYELAGRQEGFTLKAAQTTNDTLDRNSKTTLKTLNEHNLATNGYLNSQLTEAYSQGANLSSLLYTQEGYWPQAVSGISGLNSGLSSVYSGVTGLNSGLSSIYSGVSGLNGGLSSIHAAIIALGEGGGGSYGGSTGSYEGSSGGSYNGSGSTSGLGSEYATVPLGQGIYGSRYKTENALLTAKARSLNQMKYEGRTDWYPSNVRQYMVKSCGSVEAWYKEYGRNEGFAEGGITPSNRIYMVGERGPELMMSPRQWGVLNNEATDLLFNRPEPQMPQASPEHIDMAIFHDIRAGLAEIANYVRQDVHKNDKVAALCKKMKDKLDKWDNDGLPHETSGAAA